MGRRSAGKKGWGIGKGSARQGGGGKGEKGAATGTGRTTHNSVCPIPRGEGKVRLGQGVGLKGGTGGRSYGAGGLGSHPTKLSRVGKARQQGKVQEHNKATRRAVATGEGCHGSGKG